jgi:hypothetical protein
VSRSSAGLGISFSHFRRASAEEVEEASCTCSGGSLRWPRLRSNIPRSGSCLVQPRSRQGADSRETQGHAGEIACEPSNEFGRTSCGPHPVPTPVPTKAAHTGLNPHLLQGTDVHKGGYWRGWIAKCALNGGSPLRVVCHEHRRSTRGCATVREMKEGPSGSAIRSRSQTTASCCGQKPWW